MPAAPRRAHRPRILEFLVEKRHLAQLIVSRARSHSATPTLALAHTKTRQAQSNPPIDRDVDSSGSGPLERRGARPPLASGPARRALADLRSSGKARPA